MFCTLGHGLYPIVVGMDVDSGDAWRGVMEKGTMSDRLSKILSHLPPCSSNSNRVLHAVHFHLQCHG
jgi:hypothetical protein